MTAFDALRPPVTSDPTAEAYKDWFHLNIFVPESGHVVLINLSLHGPPWDRRTRVVGTALACDVQGVWTGGIEITSMSDSSVSLQSVFLKSISLAVSRDGTALHTRVQRPDDGFEAEIVAQPSLPAGALDLTAKFGSGWIGWSAVPVMSVSGHLRIDGQDLSLEGARAYHDHNWGRWFWGEDVAWEWGAFALDQDITVVVARGTDKQHFVKQPPHVFLVYGKRVIGFAPDQIDISLEMEPIVASRRLPGALAAIHPDRRLSDLPRQLVLRGDNPNARFELVFETDGAAQLLLAEPMRPGMGFINEIAGRCKLSCVIGQKSISATGLGIFEYVT
ncbi:hypothetical protein ACOTTU_17860 [Roseobacter sp. EG26]|uniref:hypothetical protein n=1 Tax=Roseobacter sp. EG26 TaxID=3412477 RepID=UPI003CE59D31